MSRYHAAVTQAGTDALTVGDLVSHQPGTAAGPGGWASEDGLRTNEALSL